MKISFMLLTFFFLSNMHAQSDTTTKNIRKKEQKKKTNKEINSSKSDKLKQRIKDQMKREKKYAKEQRFYQGDEYDLKAHEVDPASLPDVPLLEPDYDFDITDVYRDDI